MKLTLSAAALCFLALAAPAGRAEEVPNFKKKGDLEKKFVSDACVAIIDAARTSAKKPMLHRYEYKDVKTNRKELHIVGKFSGAVLGAEYTANIVVHIDSTNPNAWEVLRIEYDDNSKAPVGPNFKNLANLVKKFNGE